MSKQLLVDNKDAVKSISLDTREHGHGGDGDEDDFAHSSSKLSVISNDPTASIPLISTISFVIIGPGTIIERKFLPKMGYNLDIAIRKEPLVGKNTPDNEEKIVEILEANKRHNMSVTDSCQLLEQRDVFFNVYKKYGSEEDSIIPNKIITGLSTVGDPTRHPELNKRPLIIIYSVTTISADGKDIDMIRPGGSFSFPFEKNQTTLSEICNEVYNFYKPQLLGYRIVLKVFDLTYPSVSSSSGGRPKRNKKSKRRKNKSKKIRKSRKYRKQ